MALAPLATSDDLDARGINVPSALDEDTLLASASSAVRRAAGCAISQTTSTLTLVADDPCELPLPFGPVTAVATVVVNGVTLAGWTLQGDTLIMPNGWTNVLPVVVSVTYTHGLPTVPADIVDLVCGMVSIAAAAGAGVYGGSPSSSIRLGDFAETYPTMPPGTEAPSPFSLPDATREDLRARFGANAAAIRMH